MRRHAVALGLLALPALALAQPTPPPVIPGTVTAEATEVVRVKPDQAKVYAVAVSRNADLAAATDEAGDQAKRFADAITRLKVKGLKASVEPGKMLAVTEGRAMLAVRPGVVPGGAGGGDSQATQTVVLTVTDADPKALVEAVQKLQREVVKEGLIGQTAETGTVSLPSPYSRSVTEMVKVVYQKQEGLDDLLAAALGKATKKATARATAIADGLGLKLGPVVSADELHAPSDPAPSPAGELVEGELVRTVRVRVVYAVK